MFFVGKSWLILKGWRLLNARERRNFFRYPFSSSEATVVLEGNKFPATVMDSSIGGMCLVFKTKSGTKLNLDDPIQINHDSAETIAYVRSWTRLDQQTVRVGVSWPPAGQQEAALPIEPLQESDASPEPIPEPFDDSIALFYSHGGISVAVDAIGFTDGGDVRIAFRDGETFTVDARRLVTKTRSERHAELAALDIRKMIAKAYGIAVDCEAILKYEFSIEWVSG